MVELTISGCECLARDAKDFLETYPDDGLSIDAVSEPTQDFSRFEPLHELARAVERESVPYFVRALYSLLEVGYHFSTPYEAPMVGLGEGRIFWWETVSDIAPRHDHLTHIMTVELSDRLYDVLSQVCNGHFRCLPTPAS